MSEEVKQDVAPAAAPAAEGEAAAKKRPGKSIPAGIAFIRSTFITGNKMICCKKTNILSHTKSICNPVGKQIYKSFFICY